MILPSCALFRSSYAVTTVISLFFKFIRVLFRHLYLLAVFINSAIFSRIIYCFSVLYYSRFVFIFFLLSFLSFFTVNCFYRFFLMLFTSSLFCSSYFFMVYPLFLCVLLLSFISSLFISYYALLLSSYCSVLLYRTCPFSFRAFLFFTECFILFILRVLPCFYDLCAVLLYRVTLAAVQFLSLLRSIFYFKLSHYFLSLRSCPGFFRSLPVCAFNMFSVIVTFLLFCFPYADTLYILFLL